MAVEINKMLTLSTAHISEATAELLQRCNAADWDDPSIEDVPLVVYEKSDYGWFVVVPNDLFRINRTPPDLLMLFRLAQAQGCTWIMFDRDVEPVANLPTFNW